MENIEAMLLEVIEKPTELRVILQTEIPCLYGDSCNEHVYYMFDRTDDCGETACDEWIINSSDGGGCRIKSHMEVRELIYKIIAGLKDYKIYIDSY